MLGQPASFSKKDALAKVYSQAIGDFIKAANEKNKTGFDTIFIGNRINRQSDDFPDIELPNIIKNTPIRLIHPEDGAKKQQGCRLCIYINLIGWVDSDKAEFVFVVFSNGFSHQYDYYINYLYNAKRNEFELSKVEFKGPPFSK